MKRISIIVGIILLVAFGIIFLTHKKQVQLIIVPDNQKEVSLLKDGRQCYTFTHYATKDEPYTVHEFIDLTISGTNVTGTKSGTQNGPDMTNGYAGTLIGIVDKDIITDVFSYVIEGSHQKEKEIYRARKDQIGIEKLRYPLIEENKVLVPDTTKEFKAVLYSTVGCTRSN